MLLACTSLVYATLRTARRSSPTQRHQPLLLGLQPCCNLHIPLSFRTRQDPPIYLFPYPRPKEQAIKKMKQFTSAVLAALFAGALAHPGHGTPRANEERDLVARVGNINGTQTFNASLVDDHVPIFQAAACVCPTPVCDPRLNADSVRLSLLPPLLPPPLPPLYTQNTCAAEPNGAGEEQREREAGGGGQEPPHACAMASH